MFDCEICGYSGNFRSNLIAHKKSKRHIILVQKNLTNVNSENVNKKDINNEKVKKGNKKYNCKKCDFNTIHRSSLSRHIKHCTNNIKTNTENNKDEIIKKLEKEKNELIKTLMNFINSFVECKCDKNSLKEKLNHLINQ